MRKISYLLLLLVAVMIFPFSVFADEDVDVAVTAVEQTGKVNVYLFRGDGCPHCQEAEEWFESIKAEYGEYFQIVDYEVWYNKDNSALMDQVAKARNEEVGGVPYIVIGNKSWNGFTTDFGSEMLEQIKAEYAKPVSERYDVIKVASGQSAPEEKKEEKSNDTVALLIIVAITGAICFGVYKAKEANK